MQLKKVQKTTRTFIPSSLGEVTVLDYANSQMVSINMGLAAEENSTFKIIHVIDLEAYETTLLGESIENISNTNPIYPFRNYELAQMKSDLSKWFAWKWLKMKYLTQDHQD
ncbi:uncharacterized protein LOC127566147 [Drosophila albomicans]|uniref:Uncharacterized protein LOC127566147 n=1 Tax=Drosophila albomicans TaxID=7291 RepID=A0A9C6T259_DROAB|nr:uncharacterized protein LOC127566147 [Drosophila albomicans]